MAKKKKVWSNAIKLTAEELSWRREIVFFVLAGFFISAMSMLNIIGITKFLSLGPLSLAVGVLPYPLTFLCTDIVSEIFGKRRASLLVWVGFLMNLFVITTVWLGNWIPGVPSDRQPPWQMLNLAKPVALPNGDLLSGSASLYEIIYACTAGAVFASLIAYLAAQLVDVHLFHFWKRLTKGKHLWLRNNGSTLVSQLVDSAAVTGITFGAAFFRGETTFKAILALFFGGYLFKMVAALLDTIPFYLAVRFLRNYLRIENNEEIQRL